LAFAEHILVELDLRWHSAPGIEVCDSDVIRPFT